MSTAHETSLTSLALLLAFAEENQCDYLGYLTPFIVEIINDSGAQGVNRFTLNTAISERFGLTIPSFVIELCLKRMRASQQLRFFPLYGGTYLPGKHFAANSRPIAEKQQQSLANTRSVLTELAAFAQAEFRIKLSPQDAINTLLAYLSMYGIDCMSAYYDKSPIPIIRAEKRNIVIIQAFITHAQEHSSSLFASIITFVQAQMLANALLCPDIAQNHQSLKKLTLFLDTPLLLRILDLDYPDACKAAQEVFALCKTMGCKIAVFYHTSQETFSVMMACASHLVDPLQKGRLIRACFINRYGLKLGSLHADVALMNWMHEQEAIRVVERCAVGVGRAAAA